jgi:hypothetical protein
MMEHSRVLGPPPLAVLLMTLAAMISGAWSLTKL